jgi:hypothetical protein
LAAFVMLMFLPKILFDTNHAKVPITT